ncbi:MAG: hypothetical protein HW384_1111 [Dehalococcoidia bacterium]|nr:hypothetical protein [Dehalococcoidia bacterium]
MPLVKLSVRQPVFISMLLLALVVVGAMSYVKMGVDMMPNGKTLWLLLLPLSLALGLRRWKPS